MTMPSQYHIGGGWIRRELRLAIYLRDELTCGWCGRSVAGAHPRNVTLDHLTPREAGGSNAPRNLVTAHRACNASCGARTLTAFARSFPDPRGTVARVQRCRRRAPDLERARAILSGLEPDPRTVVRQARAAGKILAPKRSAAARWAQRRTEVPF
jgi:hypothetical protein